VDDDIRIEVEDRGRGMSPETLRQIFKPFFTTKNKGTGLGLPIARKIVMGHGGNLTVSSTPGTGTTVTIRLPRK
jgi:signal transduction histidine kinase